MADKKLIKPRMMPNNLEAEQSVLGAILIDNMVANNIMGKLKAADFYSEANAKIYEAMTALLLKSTPIDFVTVSELLEREGKLEGIGGIAYLTELTNIVPSAANAETYAEIIASDSLLRRLINAAQSIIDNGYSNADAHSVLVDAEKSIFDIAQSRDISTLKHISESLSLAMEKFEAIARDPSSGRGLNTGFKNLNLLTNGFQKSDLIILAARPSVGKTSFALNIASSAALNSASVAVFSLEMSSRQLMQRMLCSLSRIDMQRAQKGQLSAEEFSRFWKLNEELNQTKMYIDDSAQNTAADILSKCRRLKREHGLDLVVIDYLQLMVGDKDRQSKSDNRQNEVAEISRSMKIIAKELDVPVLLLSQMSRAIETRKGKSPMMSDLRESGAIEQDADIVMFLSRMEEEDSGERTGYVELTVAKHRNGPTDSLYFEFDGNCVTFIPVMKTDIPVTNTKKKKEEDEKAAMPSAPQQADAPAPKAAMPKTENAVSEMEIKLKKATEETSPFDDGNNGDLPF